jgi:hypothetical protein
MASRQEYNRLYAYPFERTWAIRINAKMVLEACDLNFVQVFVRRHYGALRSDETDAC